LLVACLKGLAAIVESGELETTGLSESNLLIKHFREGTVESYLGIDDAVVNSALHQMSEALLRGEAAVSRLATRICNRDKLESLDLEQWAIVHGKSYDAVVKCAKSFAQESLGLRLGRTVFFDEPTLSVYGKAKAEEVPIHKRLWIHTDGETPVEITTVSGVIRGYPSIRRIGRIFFLEEDHRDQTKDHLDSQMDKLRGRRLAAGLSRLGKS
jgi:hypothetical protein